MVTEDLQQSRENRETDVQMANPGMCVSLYIAESLTKYYVRYVLQFYLMKFFKVGVMCSCYMTIM